MDQETDALPAFGIWLAITSDHLITWAAASVLAAFAPAQLRAQLARLERRAV